MGKRIQDELEPHASPAIIETGAGLSTLFFLALGASKLISIAPDEALWERIHGEAEARGIDTGPLDHHCERSDVVLPPLAAAGEQVDAAFIDGDHWWPSVFVDFCYMNQMLRKGGVLFVDDTNFHSVQQLSLLLQSQPGWEFRGLTGKMAVFHKKTDERHLSMNQPFIRANTLG